MTDQQKANEEQIQKSRSKWNYDRTKQKSTWHHPGLQQNLYNL